MLHNFKILLSSSSFLFLRIRNPYFELAEKPPPPNAPDLPFSSFSLESGHQNHTAALTKTSEASDFASRTLSNAVTMGFPCYSICRKMKAGLL